MITNLVSSQYSLSTLIPRLDSAPPDTRPPSGIMSLTQSIANANASTASTAKVTSSSQLPPTDSVALLRAQLTQLDTQLRSPVTSSTPVAKTYASVESASAPPTPRISALA
jgi:hypothetical protein